MIERYSRPQDFLKISSKKNILLKNIKLILFDLDGVIIDSKLNMKKSWREVRRETKTKVKFEEYFKCIGMPFKKTLAKLKIKKNLLLIENIYKKESLKNINNIKLYPKIKKTLKLLKEKKYKIGVVTSKDKKRTKIILKKLNLKFKHVVTPEKKLRGKPFPDQINKAIKLFNSKKSETIYIGDMICDENAAKNAGVSYAHARWGYGKSITKIILKKPTSLVKIIGNF